MIQRIRHMDEEAGSSMYARSSRIQFPPDQLDKGIAHFKEVSVPAAKQVAGFAGSVLLVNRASGDCTATTFWETRDALQASEEAGNSLRTQAADAAGGKVIDVRRGEVVIREMAGPPAAGTSVRTNLGQVSPDRLDTLVDRMREEALPTVRAQRGFRALNLGIDRDSGRFAIVSVWDTPADREASFAAIQEMRTRLFGDVGAQNVEVVEYESVHVEFAAVAATAE
jgi:heme-degrading monooxygenase HmoA